MLVRKIRTNKITTDLIQHLSYTDPNLKYHMAEIRRNSRMTDRIEQLHPSAFLQIRLKYEKELMTAIKLMINIQVKNYLLIIKTNLTVDTERNVGNQL
jgi:hypothetical protein